MSADKTKAPLGSDFNPFLFAAMGEESDNSRLSVVSALARLDLDPWVEAASLAGLSREAATVRLTNLIQALPAYAHAREGAAAAARRLVPLLPRSESRPSPTLPPGRRDWPQWLPQTRALLFAALILAALLLSVALFRWPPSAHGGAPVAPVAPSSGVKRASPILSIRSAASIPATA
jgi:hypothetical protein